MNEERDLADVERRRLRAGRRRSRCRRRYSDGFQLITPGGIPLTKDEYLGAIASGSVNYLLWEPEAIDACIWTQAAPLSLHYPHRVRRSGGRARSVLAHRLLRRRDGRWRVVWSQATRDQASD